MGRVKPDDVYYKNSPSLRGTYTRVVIRPFQGRKSLCELDRRVAPDAIPFVPFGDSPTWTMMSVFRFTYELTRLAFHLFHARP